MALNSFTPNSTIRSSEVNSNFTNLSDHGRNITLKWSFGGTLSTVTTTDYLAVPDDVTWDRSDLVAVTAPVGAAIIVDLERSTDGGSTWVTIFTNTANRPQIADGSKTGNTTTIDVPAGTGNSHLWRAKIAQVGSTTAGADLNVFLKGKYNLD